MFNRDTNADDNQVILYHGNEKINTYLCRVIAADYM